MAGFTRKNQILTINSFDRLSPTTSFPEQFTVMLSQSMQGYRKIELLSVAIPNCVYNVDTWNNKIVFKHNGGATQTVTIPPGAYSLSALISTFNTMMSTATGATVTLTVNPVTFLSAITIGAGTIQFLFGSGGSNQLNPVLGFLALDTANSASITSTGGFNLAQPYNVYVAVQQLGANTQTTNRGLLETPSFIVPSDGNSTAMIRYSQNTHYKQVIDTVQTNTSISQLMITLYMPLAGSVFILNNAHQEWTMDLLFSYE